MLLIVPYGIETYTFADTSLAAQKLLIVPYGIETFGYFMYFSIYIIS